MSIYLIYFLFKILYNLCFLLNKIILELLLFILKVKVDEYCQIKFQINAHGFR